MDHVLLIFVFLFCFSMPKLYAQQNYSGNTVMDCDGSDEAGPSPAFLYACNGSNNKRPCQGFLILKSQTPYDTVSSISNLTSSNPSELARINDISNLTAVLPPDKEVIVPVSCYCSGMYYQANTSFTIPTIHDTYFSIANNTYQGLSTCNILIQENTYRASELDQGLILQVPLRCACPTSNQTANGTKFLLTYLVSWGDSVPDISERFNVSIDSVVYANGFTEDDPPLVPFTTILIPLSTEPLSHQTIIHYPPPPTSPIVPIYKYNRKPRKKFHIWVGIGVSVLLLCFVLSLVLFHQKKRRGEATRADATRKKKTSLPEDFLVNVSNLDQRLKFYKFEELEVATENFSFKNVIGGSVWRGTLNGSTVAIKRMSKNVSKEVNLLKKINHCNLISLCGACENGGVFYLVYEYMENGSLWDWLHKKRYHEFKSWNLRFQIALDVAHGLHYLHNCTDPGYVHKDISSSNILLDKDLRAKLANFSLARSTVREESVHLSTRIAVGTKGYMAPEYLEYGLVTPEMDTFAFGVVLLELLTGKEAVYQQDGEEILLAEAVLSTIGGNAEAKLGQIVDPNLQVNKMEPAHHVIKLSLACIAQEPESRPSMAGVVSSLMKIQWDVQRSQSSSSERI